MTRLSIWGAPGSGKTHTLINEVVLHLNQKFLMTTFRRDTADEIRFKLEDLTGSNISKDVVNTIHGVCYNLVGGKRWADVMTPAHIKQFNKDTGNSFNVSIDDLHPHGHNFVLGDCYGWLENTGTAQSNITKFPGWSSLNLSPDGAREKLRTYQEWKADHGIADFTDMLIEVDRCELVPDVDYLYVDEFQDLTKLQWRIISRWADQIENVIIAGDPLQSIYGFWGGSPDYFTSFGGEVRILPISRRLPTTIWEYASKLAKINGMQTPEIRPGGHSGSIRWITHKQYMRCPEILEGHPNVEVFHLVRSNYQASAIASMLARYGILWKGLNGWTQDEFDTFNAILEARTGKTQSRYSIKTLVNNYPAKYFNLPGSKEKMLEAIDQLETTQLPGIEGNIVKPELYDILQQSDPVTYMINHSETKRDKIINALAKYNKPLSFADVYTKLTTIHGSKGLEADRVFLHTGITPTIKKGMRIDRAAEARVYYVGITRTRQELYIVKDAGYNYKLPAVVA